jgi:1-deoxy-D-xylulose-5-phosphate reductoisomerase
VLNAANEVVVGAFLEGGLAFPEIAATNAAVLEAWCARAGGGALRDLKDVSEADAWARVRAREQLQQRRGSPA